MDTLFTGEQLGHMIEEIFRLHANFPKKPYKAYRKHEPVPYGVHPTFAALLLLKEERLPMELRIRGVKVLLAHDLIEDTNAELPAWCKEPDVLPLLWGVTFRGDENPAVDVWKRGDEVILLKLYDSTDNLMNDGCFSPEKRAARRDHVRKLMERVRVKWGDLYVMTIAEALMAADF